jgi:hypothetical protein
MKIHPLFFVILLIIPISCKQKKTNADIPATEKIQNDSNTGISDIKPFASIGSVNITRQIIQYRIATEEAYGNTGLTNISGLIMLTNDAIEFELAKKYNQQALPDEIEQFKQHADATSKAPDILKKIKNAYGQDIASYDFWFISPKIVNRKIRDYFSSNKEINQATLNRIKPAFKQVKSGKKMKELSKSLNLNYAVDSIPLKPLDMTPALQNYPDASLPFENPMLKYVKQMKVGEVYPEIIEENYSFLIIRLLNFNQNRYLIERISIPKLDFDSWLKKEAETIPIIIYDPQVKQELLSKYSNLWWVSYLK